MTNLFSPQRVSYVNQQEKQLKAFFVLLQNTQEIWGKKTLTPPAKVSLAFFPALITP